MKTLLLLGLLFFTLAASAKGAPSVTLAWDPVPPGLGETFHYRLYWGGSPRNYSASQTTALTNSTVTNLVAGTTYFFAAAAYSPNSSLEGDFSNEVTVRVPDDLPALTAPRGVNFHITNRIIVLTWIANPPAEMVTRYKVYHAQGTNAPVLWATTLTASNRFELAVPAAMTGHHRIAVTAQRGSTEESGLSPEVEFFKAAAPSGLRMELPPGSAIGIPPGAVLDIPAGAVLRVNR